MRFVFTREINRSLIGLRVPEDYCRDKDDK